MSERSRRISITSAEIIPQAGQLCLLFSRMGPDCASALGVCAWPPLLLGRSAQELYYVRVTAEESLPASCYSILPASESGGATGEQYGTYRDVYVSGTPG